MDCTRRFRKLNGHKLRQAHLYLHLIENNDNHSKVAEAVETLLESKFKTPKNRGTNKNINSGVSHKKIIIKKKEKKKD